MSENHKTADSFQDESIQAVNAGTAAVQSSKKAISSAEEMASKIARPATRVFSPEKQDEHIAATHVPDSMKRNGIKPKNHIATSKTSSSLAEKNKQLNQAKKAGKAVKDGAKAAKAAKGVGKVAGAVPWQVKLAIAIVIGICLLITLLLYSLPNSVLTRLQYVFSYTEETQDAVIYAYPQYEKGANENLKTKLQIGLDALRIITKYGLFNGTDIDYDEIDTIVGEEIDTEALVYAASSESSGLYVLGTESGATVGTEKYIDVAAERLNVRANQVYDDLLETLTKDKSVKSNLKSKLQEKYNIWAAEQKLNGDTTEYTYKQNYQLNITLSPTLTDNAVALVSLYAVQTGQSVTSVSEGDFYQWLGNYYGSQEHNNKLPETSFTVFGQEVKETYQWFGTCLPSYLETQRQYEIENWGSEQSVFTAKRVAAVDLAISITTTDIDSIEPTVDENGNVQYVLNIIIGYHTPEEMGEILGLTKGDDVSVADRASDVSGRYSSSYSSDLSYFADKYGWNTSMYRLPSWEVQINGVTTKLVSEEYEVNFLVNQIETTTEFVGDEVLYGSKSNGNSKATAARLLSIAYAELGNEEYDMVTPSSLDGKGSNVCKYTEWYYGNQQDAEWCAIFVSWCADQAGLMEDQEQGGIFHRYAYVPYMSSTLQQSGAIRHDYEDLTIYGGTEYTPKPGDCFVQGDDQHIGFVYEVYDTYFISIEGNRHNMVSSNPIREASINYNNEDTGEYEYGYVLEIPYPYTLASDEPLSGDAAEEAVIDFFREQGLNDAAIAGILANFYAESGVSSDIEENGGSGYGLAQWTNRRESLEEWMDENGYAYESCEGQLYFCWYELNTDYYANVLEYLQNVENTEDGAGAAARYFCVYYEGPQDVEGAKGRREKIARNVYWPKLCSDGTE